VWLAEFRKSDSLDVCVVTQQPRLLHRLAGLWTCVAFSWLKTRLAKTRALGQVTRNVTFGFPSATLVMELLGTGRFAVHRDVKIAVCSSGQRQVKVVVLAIDMHEQPLPMHARGTNGKF
jgi:hypothetical protein